MEAPISLFQLCEYVNQEPVAIIITNLLNRYRIFRYTPSQADVQVFEQVGKAPAASLPHALRWYNQIASYTPAERKAWPAGTNPLTAGGKPTTPAPAKQEEEDDDDVDLFGSGDEEEVRTSPYNKPIMIK